MGDGRPFTGPSGDTLVRWAGLHTRDELLEFFELDNLLSRPLPKNSDPKRRPSVFSQRDGRIESGNFLGRQRLRALRQLGQVEYNNFIDHGHFVVVVLGTKVWRAFGLPRDTDLFGELPIHDDFCMIRFPHPSGLNLQLNDKTLVEQVRTNLRRIGQVPSTD